MQEKVLTTLAADDQFSSAILSFNSSYLWSVEFQSAFTDVKYKLTLARGGSRYFKTLDAAFACALKIFNSSTANVIINR